MNAAPGNGNLLIGVDVGSTTVKAVVVEPDSYRAVWKAYERHETRQPEKVFEFLARIGNEIQAVADGHATIFMTGSGAGPLCEVVGARFVQEVNALTLAVEKLCPDAGSVIELGGQDAKIIIFQEDETSGERHAVTSMNDKCASGTGATIDRCLIKVGYPQELLGSLAFDSSRLHHVAAKCGVFAETDVINLIKAGVPASEVMNSLADAIVRQNLSVLTRGRTLRANVLLLGGPNTYLPFLQECWRMRIPETWAQRGYDYDSSSPVDELIIVPEDSVYFAAYGAVVFGLLYNAGADQVRFRGRDPLAEYCATGRTARFESRSGPPLFNSETDIEPFLRQYRSPAFEPPRFRPGQTVNAAIGLDGGSTSSKAVLVDDQGTVLRKAYRISNGNPIQDAKEILAELKESIQVDGARLQVIGFGATGYAAPVLEQSLCADVNIVETVAHMMSARTYFPEADVICDIGGQDIKVLFLENGDIKDFKLSNQCSAGNGMLLQSMADQFGIPMAEYAQTAFAATLTPKFSYGCAVFLDADRVTFQREGYNKEELLAGLAIVLPKNIWQYVVGVPRLAELGRVFVLQGGTQKNLAAVKTQVDYIRSRVPDAIVHTHPHCGEAGAIGAAIETLRVVGERGHSVFIGLDAAIDLHYETRNDAGTRCNFCPNHCTRTFIDTRTPDGGSARYIAGFTCEKGTVENKQALKQITRKRKALQSRCPNMVELEGELAFRHRYDAVALPQAGDSIESVKVGKDWLGRTKRRTVARGFLRSTTKAHTRRARLRIGIPRVLGLYTTAPLFRAYFQNLGLPANHIVWSEPTSDEMFTEGARYGSVDPCFPAKCVQAHIHNLLFDAHRNRRTGPLDYVFFPCLTYAPSFLSHTMDETSCTIVAGTPKVIRAAFTQEVDFFAREGVEYVDTLLNMSEPHLFNEQLWQAWGDRLAITRDEHDHALAQAWKALADFETTLHTRGRAILDRIEREHGMAVVMLGRPYHADPGINHDIPGELQALGYPILSVRSLPRDPDWLEKVFADDLADGRIADVFDIRDVWPENYSTNSAQKVWAAKIAARHPNLAVLDISSFKCGQDSPTYGIVDGILKAAGTPRLIMHDLDANKAVGSIAIRTRTFAYTLARHARHVSRSGRPEPKFAPPRAKPADPVNRISRKNALAEAAT